MTLVPSAGTLTGQSCQSVRRNLGHHSFFFLWSFMSYMLQTSACDNVTTLRPLDVSCHTDRKHLWEVEHSAALAQRHLLDIFNWIVFFFPPKVTDKKKRSPNKNPNI